MADSEHRPARRSRLWLAAVGGLVAHVVAAACGEDSGGDGSTAGITSDSESAPATTAIDPGDGGDYRPTLDPAAVVPIIDNQYLPLTRTTTTDLE
jgi:hypothetical protein